MERKRIDRNIYYIEQTDSYVVQMGKFVQQAFPTLRDALEYRDFVFAEKLRIKEERAAKFLRQKEELELKQFVTEAYPFNVADAIECPNLSEQEIQQAISDRLSPREAEYVRLKYEDGLTLDQIGKKDGIGRERVRQIIAKALRRIQNYVRRAPMRAEAHETELRIRAERENIERYRTALIEEYKRTHEFTDDMRIEFGDMKVLCGVPSAMSTNIDDMGFSDRIRNCLRRAGISTVSDLCSRTKEDMMKVRNLGSKSLKEIESKMSELGVAFKEEEE